MNCLKEESNDDERSDKEDNDSGFDTDLAQFSRLKERVLDNTHRRQLLRQCHRDRTEDNML